ncbi:MAG TPA: hypothetical protein VGO40_07360 [Longimicrobium sp.]|nr:hypothetical protein [Longimicrobium sp.]
MEFFTDVNCGKQFPRLLREAGLTVHMHIEHFEADADDVVWAPAIAERGWVGISRDRRITRTALEYDALMFAGGRLFVMTGGGMKTDLLAKNFINTLPKILDTVATTGAPYIAMVYRPSPIESILRGTPGAVKVVLTRDEWNRRRNRRFPTT